MRFTTEYERSIKWLWVIEKCEAKCLIKMFPDRRWNFCLLKWLTEGNDRSYSIPQIGWSHTAIKLYHSNFINKNLAIANRSRVSCVHNTLRASKAACQISCQSDTQIWRYSYLNFSHIAWNAYSGPQNEDLGDFGPLNVIIHHRDS